MAAFIHQVSEFNLSATRISVGRAHRQGDRVTFMVSIVNSGSIQYTGLKVEDSLGAYREKGSTVYPMSYVADTVEYYVNGVLQAVPVVTAGPPLTISGITVPAGGNVAILYQADRRAFAPMSSGEAIDNIVTVSGCGISVTAGEPKNI